MIAESRTAKSIKNAKVALLFYFINLILQFFSRKIFLEYLGAEVLGLNTTAQNLLGFLNLAELGIGVSVAYTLYKPLFHKDTQVINEIVSVQGWMYRRIAYVVIGGACILMCFFPWIFEKAQVPLWYAYGSFIVLLVSSLLGYFVNYRQIVLNADQKEYKVTLNVQGYKILKVILQILAIRYLNNGYVYWMVLELLMAFVTVFVLNCVLKREYPWLISRPSAGKMLREKYSVIIIKTKQLFFHRIGEFTFSEITPLIIYGYASLTLVAIYGNYMLIVSGVSMLMNALQNSVGAGVGNLVAEGDKVAIKRFFWELTACRFWIASVICFGIYMLAHSFIRLWVGEEYVLEQNSFLVLIFITFILLTRTNEIFLYAYGLFQDIWAPVATTLLNVGFSVILGYFFGLTGILCGTGISLFVVVCLWKPYFLYRQGFKENWFEYGLCQIKYFLLSGIAALGSWLVLRVLFPVKPIVSYLALLGYGLEVLSVYGILSLLLFYHFDQGMSDFLMRMREVILKRKNN